MENSNYDFITKDNVIVEKAEKTSEEVLQKYAPLLTKTEKGDK